EKHVHSLIEALLCRLQVASRIFLLTFLILLFSFLDQLIDLIGLVRSRRNFCLRNLNRTRFWRIAWSFKSLARGNRRRVCLRDGGAVDLLLRALTCGGK